MTNNEAGRPQYEALDYRARQQYPQGQRYGQGYGQPPWRPEQYDPQLHQQRLTGDQRAQPQHGYQPPTRQQLPGYRTDPSYGAPVAGPKRRKRVFMWVFLAIQAIFLIWLITGLASTSGSGADAHAQAVQYCADPSNWQYLFKSQADCITHYGNGLNDASDLGKGIGAGLVIGLWVATDVILGIGRLVVVLARRK